MQQHWYRMWRVPVLVLLAATTVSVTVGAQAPKDTLTLRDGRKMIGTIMSIRTDVIRFEESETQLPFEFRPDEILSIKTRNGRMVALAQSNATSAQSPVDPDRSAAKAPAETRRLSVRGRGVEGTYVVSNTLVGTVSDWCDAGATRNNVYPDKTMQLTVFHAPGATTLTISTFGNAQLTEDGAFVVRRSASNEKDWEQVLSGRFTTNGRITGTYRVQWKQPRHLMKDIICEMSIDMDGERRTPTTDSSAVSLSILTR